MTSLELLAPARNLECGKAAIDHGADAVYIGAPSFGARSAAGNSVEDIKRLCEYAHPFGARVYVTVNTIIYDDELEACFRLLDQLADAGADAVLVQDMALIRHSSLITPHSSLLTSHSSLITSHSSLPFHASTQTDNRTAEKVRWLRDIGCTRVVLARELSVEEIAAIHHQVPGVQLEVFVHGALCVSYSGLCYASQHCFHRSANRGECAQFCRMSFSLTDAEGRVVERDRHLLSLKDLNLSDHLLALIEAGATSFKIEGRLKDMSYVKNVTAAYSTRLNEIIRRYPDRYCRSSSGECQYTFSPDLRKTFNRGYTTYFLNGRQPDIASFDTPKAMGEYVGVVKELRTDSFSVAGVAAFANGDGLCFVNADRQLEGFRANRVEGNRIWPYRMPEGLRAGMRLYRNYDQELERLLAKPSAVRKIPVTLALRQTDGGYSLSATTQGQSCSVVIGAEHQRAAKPPRENLVRQLTKLGDTVYVSTGVDIPDDFNDFIPNSLLADLRRQLVTRLNHQRIPPLPTPVGAGCPKGGAGSLYPHPYLYNISNRMASDFYGTDGPSAYELRGGDGPIMQCRHCLRYALGFCVRHGGQRPSWREPLSLVLGDGRRFRLEFDCKNCQMNVFVSDE